MASRKRPASRGFVNNIILESLLSGDKYGYEIIKEVEDKSNGKIILKQPSLYSSLKRFETKGYITSYWGDSDIGGRRHYYTITEPGKNYYNRTVNKKLNRLNKNISDDEDDDLEDVEQLSYDDTDTIDVNEVDNETIDNANEESEENLVTDTNDENYNIFELLEHKENKPEPKHNPPAPQPVKTKETGIQVDMFTQQEKINEVDKEEKVNVETIQQLKINDSPITETKENNESKKEIPLIKEQTQEFFSWEDLKRKQVAQKQQEPEHKEEPIKNQVVMDENGILKVPDPTIEQKKERKIYDNVGSRIEYNDPVINNKKYESKVQEKELTEEERHIINQKFNEKLDRIIDQKVDKKRQEEPAPQPIEEDIDYKNILGELLSKEDEIVKPQPTIAERQPEYEENNNEEIPDNVVEEAINNVEQYVAEQQSTQNNVTDFGFKFKPYMTETDEKKENDFILSNKVKMKYGIFMFVLLILQISTLFIILKAKNLLYTSDYILYGVAYGLSLALLLICIIPYLVLPDKRKSNNFKLTYSLLFGTLLFLAACALTYAINTFAGLNSSNVAMFSTKLLLPIILSINFIITPIIHMLLLYDKQNY
ncbi:MAG: helix-turn-helix transcriptional regulator [Firmicutes bacterium]|nr:helix-turn-helix transcriptional regulator [Bacillota bacterium]